MSTSTLSAEYTAAEQLTFRPRTVADTAPRPVDSSAPRRPALYVVDSVPAADQLATVHRLPVVHRNEVYRRRRLVALALLVGVVLGVVSFIGSADATPTPEGRLAESVTVVVQPGDTLWAIAESLAPNEDPRPLVARLTEVAGSASVQPGQEIVVPGTWLD